MDSAANSPSFTLLLIGFALGLQQAVEAVIWRLFRRLSARKSRAVTSIVGGLWGLGHTVFVLIVGGLVVLLKVPISEPPKLGWKGWLLMLIALGINAFAGRSPRINTTFTPRTRRPRACPFHAHKNGRKDRHHVTASLDPGRNGPRPCGQRRADAARSAGHADAGHALGYIAVFGIGSIIGMAAMSFSSAFR